jgi:hypothetical protein
MLAERASVNIIQNDLLLTASGRLYNCTNTGSVTSVMDTASVLFGGIFGQAADLSERVRSAGWQKAHDDAFGTAMEELRPDFVQCPRYSSWVCRASCWNNQRGLCKECAPDMGVEMAAAQASRTVEEV